MTGIVIAMSENENKTVEPDTPKGGVVQGMMKYVCGPLGVLMVSGGSGLAGWQLSINNDSMEMDLAVHGTMLIGFALMLCAFLKSRGDRS